jgi:hypothetical protein
VLRNVFVAHEEEGNVIWVSTQRHDVPAKDAVALPCPGSFSMSDARNSFGKKHAPTQQKSITGQSELSQLTLKDLRTRSPTNPSSRASGFISSSSCISCAR